MLTSSGGNLRVGQQNRHYFFSTFFSDFGLTVKEPRRATRTRYVREVRVEERVAGRKVGRVSHLFRACIGDHNLRLKRKMAWLFYSTLEEECSSRFLSLRPNAFIFTRLIKSYVSVYSVLPAWVIYIFYCLKVALVYWRVPWKNTKGERMRGELPHLPYGHFHQVNFFGRPLSKIHGPIYYIWHCLTPVV